MLSLLVASALVQMPDTSLRLKTGDSWTQEYVYQYEVEDVTFTTTEHIVFVVTKEQGKDVLTARWALKQEKVGEDVVPPPKELKPLVRKVDLTGVDIDALLGDDVSRHRIERALQIERKGRLAEPTFFPVPPNVRLVGFGRKVELDPRVKDRPVLAVAFQESAGEKPLKAIGYYELHPATGILLEGHWTLIDAPVLGGDGTTEMEVTVKTKDLKLASRKS